MSYNTDVYKIKDDGKLEFMYSVKCELVDLYDLCANSEGAFNNPPIDKMFTPIPLTEEWLVKFGFKKRITKVRSGASVTTYDNGTVYDLKLAENNLGFDFRYDSIEIVELKYVHQLQNLYFALTKTELTLKC